MAQLQAQRGVQPPSLLAKSLKKINSKMQAFKCILNLPVSKVGADWAGHFDFSIGFYVLAI